MKNLVYFILAALSILILIAIGLLGFIILNFNIDSVTVHTSDIDTIQISQAQVDQYNALFNDGFSRDKEYVLCLMGYIDDNTTIYVTDYYIPPVENYLEDHSFVSGSCKKSGLFSVVTQKDMLIGTLHNHNSGICKASEIDYYTFGESDLYLMMIQCSEGNFIAYTPNTIVDGLIVEVTNNEKS